MTMKETLTVTLVVLAASCSRPDSVQVIRSHEPGLLASIETFNGEGATVGDATTLYAGLERDGRVVSRERILDGEYLKLTHVQWSRRDTLDVCIAGGDVSSYRSDIVLRDRDRVVRVHTAVRKDC